jgi:hypothetical protein
MSQGDPETTVAPLGERGGDPQTSSTLVVAVVGAILVFVIIVALQAFFYHSEETERAKKVYAVAPEELARLRATQQEQISTYRWVDRDRRIVAIPIDRAMELTVRDQGRNTAVVASSATPKSGDR